MKTCPTTRRVTRSLDHDLLAAVLARLERDLLDTDPGHGLVMFGVVETDDDGLTLATRHRDVDDPIQAMIGFSAPREWSAFGIVAQGRSRPLVDGPCLQADLDATPEPVRMAFAITRTGLAVRGLRSGRGPFTIADEGSESLGRIPDACRRVMGLGTPAPAEAIEDFFALLWVDHVLAAAAAEPGSLSWPAAADLHFGAGLVDELALPEALSPHEALAIGHELVRDRLTWHFVRRHASQHHEPTQLFDPEAAAWMDDGMFSRELLGSFPPLPLMLDALEQVATPELFAGVERTLAGWQLV